MNNLDDINFVAGGVGLSRDRVRDDIYEFQSLVATTELDRRIVQLLMLHKEVNVRFRNRDLSVLDTPTKKDLLNDIYMVLGIKKLKDDQE
jgi:hypothetical protein